MNKFFGGYTDARILYFWLGSNLNLRWSILQGGRYHEQELHVWHFNGESRAHPDLLIEQRVLNANLQLGVDFSVSTTTTTTTTSINSRNCFRYLCILAENLTNQEEKTTDLCHPTVLLCSSLIPLGSKCDIVLIVWRRFWLYEFWRSLVWLLLWLFLLLN